MTYCLLRIAQAPTGGEWGGMVYAEGTVLGGIGPCKTEAEVVSKAEVLWPTALVESKSGLRDDGEPLTGYASLDLDNSE